MGWKHYRGIGGRRVERGQVIALRQLLLDMSNPEIDLILFVFAPVEPSPGIGQGIAVNRVPLLLLGIGLVATYEDNRSRVDPSSHAIQPAKALTQRVKARTLSDKTIEVEIGPNFQGLSGDDD